jgi:hypothetical protein
VHGEVAIWKHKGIRAIYPAITTNGRDKLELI